MLHPLFSSLEEMISPESLSRITGTAVASVTRQPLSAGFAHSGSSLEFLETRDPAGGVGPRLVIKRIAPEWDWLMRATRDQLCRSVTLWTSGILDDLPPACAPPLLTACRDSSGWAILMTDHSASMLTNRPFTVAENELLLDAAAAIHATYLGDSRVAAEQTGLCTTGDVYRMFAPATARGEIERGNRAELPSRILEGWKLAREVMPRDVMECVDPLLDDPAPLCAALGRYPTTLVHGDYRHSNLALSDGVVTLDWQLAACAPPAVELGRYLGANSPLLPVSKEECLLYYGERFARHLTSGAAMLNDAGLNGARPRDTQPSDSQPRDAQPRDARPRDVGPRDVGPGDVPPRDAQPRDARPGQLPSWWQPQLELGLLGGFVQDGWAIVLKATHWHVGAEARDHWKRDLAWWTEQVRRGRARL